MDPKNDTIEEGSEQQQQDDANESGTLQQTENLTGEDLTDAARHHEEEELAEPPSELATGSEEDAVNVPPRTSQTDGQEEKQETTSEVDFKTRAQHRKEASRSSSRAPADVTPGAVAVDGSGRDQSTDNDNKNRASVRTEEAQNSKQVGENNDEEQEIPFAAATAASVASAPPTAASATENLKGQGVIQNSIRRSRELKMGSDDNIISQSSSESIPTSKPGAVGVSSSVRSRQSDAVEQEEKTSIEDEEQPRQSAVAAANNRSTAVTSPRQANEPIVAQLVDEGNETRLRQELREDVRKEIQQEMMLASAIATNAVQVEVVTQDEENHHQIRRSGSGGGVGGAGANPYSFGDDDDGNPIRRPVDTGLVCVGLYMILAMAIASLYLTEFFGNVCYGIASFFYSIAPFKPSQDDESSRSTINQKMKNAILRVLRFKFLLIFVFPCAVADFCISMMAVAWTELHVLASVIFVGTLNGCDSGRRCGVFIKQVCVWTRWKIRINHKNWSLSRDYLMMEKMQEEKLDDVERLQQTFVHQQQGEQPAPQEEEA